MKDESREMKDDEGPEQGTGDGQPHRVRLPGFITDDEVGLGDVIKHATRAVGIRPCGECTRRAAKLNQWMVFSGRPSTRK
jgi:hypothetical protein